MPRSVIHVGKHALMCVHLKQIRGLNESNFARDEMYWRRTSVLEFLKQKDILRNSSINDDRNENIYIAPISVGKNSITNSCKILNIIFL